MAQDLPDDVWSQLAETWLNQRALQNMSLTSRRMHLLVVPVLFRGLQFHIIHAESEPFVATLIRNITRARFLFNSPELLRHTRFFKFLEDSFTADSIADYLALHEGSDSSSARRDAENFRVVCHNAIYRLIFRMPGLRGLLISNTVITPLFYAAISSRPLLTTLYLSPKSLPDITHINPAVPYALRLRDFTYYDTWTGNELQHPTDPYLADILDHCILELENLEICSPLLPLVASRIPSHRTLSLRALSVEFPLFSSNGPAAAAFLPILRACPQLRHISVGGKFSYVEPTYLPPPSLPNLSTFSGTSRLLQMLSGGTNLVKIDIDGKFKIIEQSLTQVILSPPTHLRELSMGRVIFATQATHEFFTFIRSLSVFQNLEKLKIAYPNDISWNDHASAQVRLLQQCALLPKAHRLNIPMKDSHSAIKDLLHQLSRLRFLDIHCRYGAVEVYDIGCPISQEGEPANRGHPSLEGIHVDFLCGMWSWTSRTGWERRDWGIHSWLD